MTFESQITDQAGQTQLDRVATEFEQWRSQKKSSAERVPKTLLREAQRLSQHVKATEVRRRLGLTKGQIDKLDALDQVAPNTPNQTADFVRLDPETPSTRLAQGRAAMPTDSTHVTAHPELTIDVCTPQGVTISLSGFAAQDPLAMIAKLLE